MSKLYYLLPKKLRKPADILKKKILNFGISHFCPICNSFIRGFKPFGGNKIKPRANVICPVCGSFERHRFFWLLLKKKTNLFDGHPKKMLHIAPEKALIDHFKQIVGIDYLSGDLLSPLAMVKLDLTQIDFPDNSFDVIFCSHVLEHIPNDSKAISELSRVLTPEGWMLLAVPIKEGLKKTEEDLNISDPKERLKRFGNIDHVRIYGEDFEDKMLQLGLYFNKYNPYDIISEKDFSRFGLNNETVYICKNQ